MTLRPSVLWSPRGTIDRVPYALVGLVGFLIKHNLDRLVAASFGREWSLTSYWMPFARPGRLSALVGENRSFFAALLVLALPFIWVGVVLTLKRLRSAGLPLALVVLFFVPYLNLLVFLFLCIVPSLPGAVGQVPPPQVRPGPTAGGWMPENRLGSALMALMLAVLFGLLCAFVSATCLGLYSWNLFVGTPFCMGLIATLLHGSRRPRRFGDSALLAIAAPVLLAVALVGSDIEGAICLLMAAPLGAALSFMGGMIGHGIQDGRWRRRGAHAVLSLVLLSMPILMGADRLSRPRPPLLMVTTTIEVQAPPERVWQWVVSFTKIPSPSDWLFRAGIAYPVHAVIEGRGPGAMRHCVFSTGEFVEPIEIWDEPRLLEFSVLSNPPPMVEWTPYSRIHAPHLGGYFAAQRGQFLLSPLPGGRTRLEGTTWYLNAMWPGPYWRLWSDAIVHRIHARVLDHVRRLAEGDAS